MATPSNAGEGSGVKPLGQYLRDTRRALGLSLRAVEEATQKAVTNGYLSQIETGLVERPSPNVLYHLAEVYGIDYGDLLVRAGHKVPIDQAPANRGTVPGLPLSALSDLTEGERSKLLEYIAFLRSTRRHATGGDA